MEMKLLQILAVVAIFSGVHSVSFFSAASSEDIEQAKAKLLDLYSKVESSLDSGVQKLSKDFTTQLDSTSKAMKTKFEEHKEKFANSEYASQLNDLQDTLKEKHQEIAKDVAKTIAKASKDAKVHMEATKSQINAGIKDIKSEGKEKFLQLFAEVEKQVDLDVQKMASDFTTQLETSTASLKGQFDQHKEKFDAKYAGKLNEFQDTLKEKHSEISKDVVKTIAQVSADVHEQMEQAKDQIKNLHLGVQEWFSDEL